MTSHRLETDRLSLRPIRRSDAPRIAELINDLDIARMTTSIPHPYALDDAWSFVEQVERYDPAEEQVFAVDHPEDGLIGTVGFHRGGRPLQEVGYWLGKPWWGQGYATEATRAALAWASRQWGRRAVLSSHFADNAASAGVLIKSGFLYTGEVQRRPSLARGEAAPTRMMVWLA